MADEREAVSIAAIRADVIAHPPHRGRTIPHKGGIPYLGDQAVIRHGDDEPSGRERFGGEAIILAASAGPPAAVEEDEDRGLAVGTGGRVEVEFLARMRAIGRTFGEFARFTARR